MTSFTNFLFKPLLNVIHKDFHDVFKSMTLIDKFIFLIVHSVDKLGKWHRLPVIVGLIYLILRRRLHQNYNLFNVGKKPVELRSDGPARLSEEGSFFGRNILPVPQSNKLLARRKLIDTGKQFNVIAASWIQFMIHDWVDHIESSTQVVELLAPEEVASQCPLKSFKFYKSKEIQIKNGDNGIKSGDGSAIYGSDQETMQKVRTFKDGKLKISEDGLLIVNPNGTVLTGDVRNIWAGLSVLQALFVKEHNAICDALMKEYPNLEDEELYRHARVVTSAVIAKVHTIDWTVELLKTDMYGLLGKKIKDTIGHTGVTLLSGIVGSNKPVDHGVPYSLTEEFVSVYRMHTLLPDKLLLRNIDALPGPNKSPPPQKEIDMEEMIGQQGTQNLSKIGLAKLMVSMGHQSCGAIELWNYPLWFRNLISQNIDGTDRPDPIDLPALEIYRDRERSVARYNHFRRSLMLIPIAKWEDLTDDEQAIDTLRHVYGDDVEELDTMVGLTAEKKIPGRLEADRFFTSDFNEDVYTKKGLEWVNTTESLKDVLDRHFPEMSGKWMNSTSAFSVWDAPLPTPNPVPLYFRPIRNVNSSTASPPWTWSSALRAVAKSHQICAIHELNSDALVDLYHRNFAEPSEGDGGNSLFAFSSNATRAKALLNKDYSSLEDVKEISHLLHIMTSFTNFLFKPLLNVIHKDFHDVFKSMTLIDKFIFLIVHSVDKLGKWHRLPVIVGLIYLILRQRLHQNYNLFNVGKKPVELRFDGPSRFSDEGSFFGRNILPVMRPDPMVVATKLLTRRKLIDTGKQFNVIAASWIQFMIHDWVDHIESSTQVVELWAPEEVASQCPLKSFRFYKSKEIQIKNGDKGIKSGDGSAIYGSDQETMQKVRTFKDGKLKISEDGLLIVNPNGTVLTGDVRNIWAGLSVLQALFVKEHNAICDALMELYRHARVVTSAVIAKVHTIDWTVELLKTDMLLAGMRGNWYGLLGKRIKDTIGHTGLTLLSGIVGSNKPVDHGVPYSLTEEFVSVYRMHTLLPDKLLLRNIDAIPGPNKSPPPQKEIDMEEMIGQQGTQNLSKIGLAKLMVSMGHQSCGAIELWNYPLWFRNLISQNFNGTNRPDPIDLPALEIYRDRERSVARYNHFRRSLMLIPIAKWEDLTDDEEAIDTLRHVYGDDVEELDTMVGLTAEKKIPGRLEADRFFTSDFNEDVYTKKGLEWVNTTESLKDVLDRHFQEMSGKWMNSASAFSVWDAPLPTPNPVPLYFRRPN
ncbi:alpha-dioxygenase 2 [Striga asiatica]|uniref:Alpha-dioxygenase 2 n=1 Tax=Striga asiatica TaxID=4170 RepID=A0A5A7P9C1_STRAF|nr:alpha-dioxygenase 2 [Striga asiatica]